MRGGGFSNTLPDCNTGSLYVMVKPKNQTIYKMKKYLASLLVIITILSISCSPKLAHLYETKAMSSSTNKESSFENDTVRIAYSFIKLLCSKSKIRWYTHNKSFYKSRAEQCDICYVQASALVGLAVRGSASVQNFNNIFSIGHLFRDGHSMNSQKNYGVLYLLSATLGTKYPLIQFGFRIHTWI